MMTGSRVLARTMGLALWTAAAWTAVAWTVPTAALAQDLSIGPLSKDQIRRKLLDACVYGAFRAPDVKTEVVVEQCQCASARVTAPMKPGDVEAFNRDATVVSTRSTEVRAALAGC